MSSAIEGKAETERTGKWLPLLTAVSKWLPLLTAVSTCWLAVFATLAWREAEKQVRETEKQVRETEKQVREAEKQVRAAEKQIVEMQTDKRPWIGLSDIKSLAWPKRDRDTMNFALAFFLKNPGRSPATVFLKAAIITDREHWRAGVSQVCREAKEEVRKKGWSDQWTVLPNDEWPYHLYWKDLRLEGVAKIQQEAKGCPMVVGCVVYGYGSATKSNPWSTGFVGTLSVENPNAPTHAKSEPS